MKIRSYVSYIFLVIVTLLVGILLYRVIVSETSGGGPQISSELQSLEGLRSEGLTELPVVYLSDNSNFKLQIIKSPIVILNFWASWCGPCVEEFPSLISLISDYKGQVALLAVSLDSDLNQAESFLKAYNYKDLNIHILSDPTFEIAQKMGTTKLPESYILGPDRKLIKKISGTLDWSTPDMKSYITNLLSNP